MEALRREVEVVQCFATFPSDNPDTVSSRNDMGALSPFCSQAASKRLFALQTYDSERQEKMWGNDSNGVYSHITAIVNTLKGHSM